VPTERITLEVEQDILREVDRWVASGEFADRSQAVQAALRCLARSRPTQRALMSALARLDPEEEAELADERLDAEVPWSG
jgi:Arc/MetJ-type ribon-helix-helix transcriptional regulator